MLWTHAEEGGCLTEEEASEGDKVQPRQSGGQPLVMLRADAGAGVSPRASSSSPKARESQQHWQKLKVSTTQSLAGCLRWRRWRCQFLGGSKSSMGLPEGSSSRICLPPLPPTISLRKCALTSHRASTSPARSSTSSWMRHPPPSGI